MSQFIPIDDISCANAIAHVLGYERERFIFGHNGARMDLAKLGDRSFCVRLFGHGRFDAHKVRQFSGIFNPESGKYKYYSSTLLIPTPEQIADHKKRYGWDTPRISFEREYIREDGVYEIRAQNYSANDRAVKVCDTQNICREEMAERQADINRAISRIPSELCELARFSKDPRFNLGL